MATGIKPRDDDIQFSRTDLEAIQDAMKNKQFRDLLSEYCDEVRDPANQAIYQKEMTQLEKERGYDVTFINPKSGYVIKTSVAGDRKAFINICSNENVAKPSCSVQEVNGQKGMNWQIPYSMIPPREDYDQKKQRCVIYDVVFHPDTLRMAEVNKRFRELVNKTAFDGLQKTYNIHLDGNNVKFPRSEYKGMVTPAVIRKEDPNYKPPSEEELNEMSPELVEKMFPQRSYAGTSKPINEEQPEPQEQKRKAKKNKTEFTHVSDKGYTIPKYSIKQQRNVDLQEFTYHKDSKQYSAIPSHLVVEINLPLLSSTKDCVLDVEEKSLTLTCEKPAKYKLQISLPYAVNDENGNAKFDKTKHLLIVTLPVIKNTSFVSNEVPKSLKADSGVESEGNSSSASDDENPKENFIVELSSSPAIPETKLPEANIVEETFLDSTVGYTLPTYTHNVLDDTVAFTFHVKNTEPDSVKVKNDGNNVYIKFTSIGSGFVPVHYAAILTFDETVKFENISGEAWDNNVILQLELAGDAPQKFAIGLSKEVMTTEYLDVSQVKRTEEENNKDKLKEEEQMPVVEVTNLGTETNIVVSSNHHNDYDEDDLDSPDSLKDIVFTDLGNSESEAKSILRKPMSMMRSFSESSVGDVASSMDYISSDCIPEESSLKKTVRFNDVIARQFYRYNSSIEGQKKKNQRKKSKKRNQDRRKSESEAEDDVSSTTQASKSRLKSALKPRRDSGLVDTSDAEGENQTPLNSLPDDDINENLAPVDTKKSILNIIDNNGNTKTPKFDMWQSSTKPVKENLTCDNIKHNTDLYDPDKLNKGQYLEVQFKNDLIFDLDM